MVYYTCKNLKEPVYVVGFGTDGPYLKSSFKNEIKPVLIELSLNLKMFFKNEMKEIEIDFEI